MRVEQDGQNLLLSSYSRSLGSSTPSDDLIDLSQGSPNSKPATLNQIDLIGTVRRNILLIAGIASLAGIIAASSSLNSERSYQGEARILVEPITSQARSVDPSALTARAGSADTSTVDYPTLLQVLKSPQVLAKIAAEIQTRYPDVTAESLSQDLLQENLLIQRPGTNLLDASKIVEIKYQGSPPQKVQFVLEQITKGFLKYSLEDRKSRIGGGVQFIEDQLPSLQQRVNNLEAEMQSINQRYRTTDPVSQGDSLSKQLQEARALQLQTQRDLIEQQANYLRLQRLLGLTPEEALSAAALSENTSYQGIVAEIKKLDAQIATKAARFNEESPVLRSLLDQRNNLLQLLDAEARKNLGQQVTNGIASSKVLAYQSPTRLDLIKQLITAANTTQQLQLRSQGIAQTQAFLDRQLQQYPVVLRQYNDLKQRLEIARSTLNQFLTQRETLRIEAAQKEVPWEVIAAPTLVSDEQGNPMPSSNKTLQKLILGMAAGAVLGLLIAFLKEKKDDVFYGAKELQKIQLPVLSTIPFKNNLNQSSNTLTGMGSDAFSKAFSSLYTSIRFLASDPAISSVVVGSASSGDGKTTVALHLAIEAASMGQRVLLVDADLHSPHLHAALSLPNSSGLSEALIGQAEVEELFQRSQLSKNLSVLTAGQSLLDATRLLASPEMKHLMQRLHNSFDLVIYDTAALSEFSDANFLTSYADGLLMVVGIRRTKCSTLAQVLSELERFRLPILGIVPNYTGRGTAGSRNRDLQYGQGYNGQPTLDGLKLPGVSTFNK